MIVINNKLNMIRDIYSIGLNRSQYEGTEYVTPTGFG